MNDVILEDRRNDRTVGSHGFTQDLRTQILDALSRSPECDLEELVRCCPTFTWNQVFLEVDHLSRTGEVRLRPKRAGVYVVALSRDVGAGTRVDRMQARPFSSRWSE